MKDIGLKEVTQNYLQAPVGIFDYLCQHHQDIFRPSARRTLERRIANWRSVHGSPKDVIFLQTHGYGELGR
ncbi:hypothetical protein [Oligella urethralis]|uniref:hypothetical protein n=1 Tax=Oligella urethralis TaxID=90245 RepID=UPI001CECE2AD|nr:hypothetical protein [Oligella urethralis]